MKKKMPRRTTVEESPMATATTLEASIPPEHHSPGAESVGGHAPQELAHAVRDAERDVDVARHDRRQPDRGVVEKPELGHRESPARKVEPGVGEPGDAEDPPAPAFVDRVPPRRSYGLTSRSSLRWRRSATVCHSEHVSDCAERSGGQKQIRILDHRASRAGDARPWRVEPRCRRGTASGPRCRR